MTDEQKALREAVVKLYADKYQITDAWLADAAIAVVLERAANIVDRNAELCTGNIMLRDILAGNAAAIRALISPSGAGPSRTGE